MLVMALPLKPQREMLCLFPLIGTISINQLGVVVIVVYRDVYGEDHWQQGTSECNEKKSSA